MFGFGKSEMPVTAPIEKEIKNPEELMTPEEEQIANDFINKSKEMLASMATKTELPDTPENKQKLLIAIEILLGAAAALGLAEVAINLQDLMNYDPANVLSKTAEATTGTIGAIVGVVGGISTVIMDKYRQFKKANA